MSVTVGFSLRKLFEDTFQRANESPLSGNGNWNLVSGANSLQIVSDVCEGTELFSSTGCTENYSGGLPNDQYAQITIGAPGSDESIAGVVVRSDATQANALFALFYGGSLATLTVEESSGNTEISSTNFALSFVTGDVLALAALGMTWFVLKNGSIVATGSIQQVASGQSSIWLAPLTALNSVTVTDFQAGGVTATPSWVSETVISQYGNSPSIDAIIDSMDAAIDVSADIDNFYDWIWNIDTAQGFGLDIWGRILGVSRVLDIEINGSNVLPDYAYLLLLQLKAAENIWDGTIAGMYNIFNALFSGLGYTVQVFDNLNMTMLVLFGNLPGSDPYVETVMERYFTLRPAGVLAVFVGQSIVLQDTSGQKWLVYLDDNGIFNQIAVSAGTVVTPIIADASLSGDNWPILISTNGELELGTSVSGTYPSSVAFQTAPSWLAAQMIVDGQTIKAVGSFV